MANKVKVMMWEYDAYCTDHTRDEVRATYGITNKTIYNYKKLYGIAPMEQKKKLLMDGVDKEEYIYYKFHDCLTKRGLADRYGVSPGLINIYEKKNNIPTLPKDQYWKLHGLRRRIKWERDEEELARLNDELETAKADVWRGYNADIQG